MSANPFSWMPKPGQSVEITGGRLWCNEWTVNRNWHTGEVTGDIVFRFAASMDGYDKAMKPAELPAPVELLNECVAPTWETHGCSTPGCGFPDGKPCIRCGLIISPPES